MKKSNDFLIFFQVRDPNGVKLALVETRVNHTIALWKRTDAKLAVVWEQNDVKLAVVWEPNDVKLAVVWEPNDVKLPVVWKPNDVKSALVVGTKCRPVCKSHHC